MLKALENLKPSWEEIKSKGTMTVYKGSKKHEHLMTRPLIRRILGNKITKIQWAKNLEFLMKDGPDSNIPS